MTTTDDIATEGAKALGSFPGAYQQLSRVLADPAANADRIAAAIQVDPALTGRLLHFVNSAQGPARPILSVPHAVMLLGANHVRELATASAVVHMFRGIPEHLVDMGAFWRHSFAVAIAAEALARAARYRGPSLFVPGLLHDIGALTIYLVRPREARRILIETENRGAPMRGVEQEVLGQDHAAIGERLQEQWGLPEVSPVVARFHHTPDEAPAEHQAAVDFVHLADVAVSALQIGNAGERDAHPLCEAAWDRVGLPPTAAFRALSDLDLQVAEVAAVLEA